jgi:O-methyltransferase involved in polyketide biosynthesis
MDAKEPSRGIVLTYRPPSEYLDDDSANLLTAIEPVLAQLGEPFLDGLAPAEIADLVRDCGLTVDENVEPAELEARYFAGRVDGLRPYSLERILSASLPWVPRKKTTAVVVREG